MAASHRALLILALLSPALASATPEYLEAFLKKYKASGKLEAASCAICHTEVPKHNGYGKAVNDAMKGKGAVILDAALLKSIEGEDSDGDGAANGDEIRANLLPGNARSYPPGTTKPSTGPRPGPTAAEPVRSPLLPKHAFHPQIVHFPVALFLFGGALDLLGMTRRRSEVRRAGIWNMTAGTIATALAIPTGFFAASFSGYPLEWGSAVVNHLLFAIGATVLMTGLVAWRARREPEGLVYVALLLLTIGLVGWAGHLGGGLVYGP